MNVFKMKRFFKTLLIIACVISCMDCTHMKRRVQESIKDAEWIDSEGDFYTRAVGWDYYRLPLIDPFEADNIRGDDWGIQNHILDSISMLYSVDGIKGINVVNRISSFIVSLIMLVMNLNNVDLFWEDKLC